MRLFIDMDGVLTDFDLQFKKYFGEIIKINQYKDDLRVKTLVDQYLTDIGSDFWADMPWMPGAKEFWNALTPWNPEILSAPHFAHNCCLGKLAWCQRELGPSVIVNLNPDKASFSTEKDILVDDSYYNGTGWKGHFVLHETCEQTCRLLESLGVKLAVQISE